MNMNTIIWGIVFVMVAYMIYDKVFTKKGEKIIVEWYKLRKNQIQRHLPGKVFLGYLVRQGQTHKLILPKTMSKLPIEGCHPRDYEDTTSVTPVVKVLQLGVDEFTVIRQWTGHNKDFVGNNLIEKSRAEFEVENTGTKAKYSFLANYDQYIVEKDVTYWAEQAQADVELRHKVDGDKWKPYIIVGLALLVCAGMLFYTVNKSSDLISSAQKQSWEESNSNANKLLDIFKRTTGLEEKETTVVSTQADKPPDVEP